MLTATNYEKNELRKIKDAGHPVAETVRAVMKNGIKGTGGMAAYIQFGSDIKIYGLWEALLLALSYQDQECYRADTVQDALAQGLRTLIIRN